MKKKKTKKPATKLPAPPPVSTPRLSNVRRIRINGKVLHLGRPERSTHEGPPLDEAYDRYIATHGGA